MKNGKTMNRGTAYFCFLCCLVYFTSYLTRIDYAAVLVEIIADLGITKSTASIAVTGSFITYGLGQLVSGWLGDKISPRYLIAGGLCCTSVTNLLMSVLPDITVMTVFWCFNGFFQAMLWPPLVRIMAENLDENTYSNASVSVSAAASIATIVVYLLAPVVILFSGWRTVFLICGSAGFVTILLGSPAPETHPPAPQSPPIPMLLSLPSAVPFSSAPVSSSSWSASSCRVSSATVSPPGCPPTSAKYSISAPMFPS